MKATAGGHQQGVTYFCAYWREFFKVIALHNPSEPNWAVTVKWADGRKTTHATLLTDRDFDIPIDVKYLDSRGRLKTFTEIHQVIDITLEQWESANNLINSIHAKTYIHSLHKNNYNISKIFLQ